MKECIEILEKLYKINSITPTINRELQELVCGSPDPFTGGSPSWYRVREKEETCTVEELVKEKGIEEVLKDVSRKVFNKGKKEVIDHFGKYLQVK